MKKISCTANLLLYKTWEVFPIVDDFEVKHVYKERTYERHQFSFSIDGKKYKGDFHEDQIHWLHPHPKQDLDKEQLNWIEQEVQRLLGEHGVKEIDDENIDITPMFEKQIHEAHQFKLTILGDEFRGIIRDGKLEWFHPKPRRKFKDSHVEKIEEKVHEKVEEQKNDTNE